MKTVPPKRYATQLIISSSKGIIIINKAKLKYKKASHDMIWVALPRFMAIECEVLGEQKEAKMYENGEWENRTPDLVHAKHALYQLS